MWPRGGAAVIRKVETWPGRGVTSLGVMKPFQEDGLEACEQAMQGSAKPCLFPVLFSAWIYPHSHPRAPKGRLLICDLCVCQRNYLCRLLHIEDTELASEMKMLKVCAGSQGTSDLPYFYGQ